MSTSTQSLQAQLAAYLRAPEEVAPPLPTERAAVYADLVYRNLEGLLSSTFPVLKRLEAADAWERRVRRFLLVHRCGPAEFHRAAGCFVDHCLDRARAGDEADWRVAELAHYEWVEMVLAIAADQVDFSCARAEIGAKPEPVWMLSPLAAVLAYRYPVHRFAQPDDLHTAAAAPSFLLVRRCRDERVRFMALTALSWALLEHLRLTPDGGWEGAVAGWSARNPALAAAIREQSPALQQQFVAADVLVPAQAVSATPHFVEEDPHGRMPLRVLTQPEG